MFGKDPGRHPGRAASGRNDGHGLDWRAVSSRVQMKLKVEKLKNSELLWQTWGAGQWSNGQMSQSCTPQKKMLPRTFYKGQSSKIKLHLMVSKHHWFSSSPSSESEETDFPREDQSGHQSQKLALKKLSKRKKTVLHGRRSQSWEDWSRRRRIWWPKAAKIKSFIS